MYTRRRSSSWIGTSGRDCRVAMCVARGARGARNETDLVQKFYFFYRSTWRLVPVHHHRQTAVSDPDVLVDVGRALVFLGAVRAEIKIFSLIGGLSLGAFGNYHLNLGSFWQSNLM